MNQITKQLFIKAPIEKVWQIWVDVEKTPEWVHGVKESRVTGIVKEGKGLEWQEKCLLDGRPVEMEHEFTEFEPLKRTVIKTALPMGGSLERVVEFRQSAENVEINASLTWDLGMISMFVPEEQIRGALDKSFSETAKNWKAKAEIV